VIWDATNRRAPGTTNNRIPAIRCTCCRCRTVRNMNSRDIRTNMIRARWHRGNLGIEDEQARPTDTSAMAGATANVGAARAQSSSRRRRSPRTATRDETPRRMTILQPPPAKRRPSRAYELACPPPLWLRRRRPRRGSRHPSPSRPRQRPRRSRRLSRRRPLRRWRRHPPLPPHRHRLARPTATRAVPGARMLTAGTPTVASLPPPRPRPPRWGSRPWRGSRSRSLTRRGLGTHGKPRTAPRRRAARRRS
jgi:hypothetical protein